MKVTSPLVQGYLTQAFSATHPAIDIGWNSYGIVDPKVLAWGDGVVVESSYEKSSGNCVAIKHPVKGADFYYLTRYIHLKSRAVVKNDGVKCGQAIGIGDSTGNSTGNHLHLEIWVCPNSFEFTTINVDYKKRLLYAKDPRTLFYTNMKGSGFRVMSITPSNMPTVLTTYTQVNMRGLPSKNAISVGYMPPNVTFPYLGKTDMQDGYIWAKFLYGDQVYYSAINYLTIKEVPTTEIVEKIVEVPVVIDSVLQDSKIMVTVKTL